MTGEDNDGMTEQEWMHYFGNPSELFDSIPKELRKRCRKVVLYVCACCQRVRSLFPSEDFRAVIDWGEEQADHLSKVNTTDLSGRVVLDMYTIDDLTFDWPEDTVDYCLAWSARWLSVLIWADNDDRNHTSIPNMIAQAVWLHQYGKPSLSSPTLSHSFARDYSELPAEVKAERDAQCFIMRDVFGNPFRPIVLDPHWLTPTVLALANQMYESRDVTMMPILADALQDAGCDNDDILNHCRDEKQVHVRGCWVVDLVLGKS